MFKKISAFAFIFLLSSCAAPAAPQANPSNCSSPPIEAKAVKDVKGSLIENLWCDLGTPCDESDAPADELVTISKRGKNGRTSVLFALTTEKIKKETAGKACDFVIEGIKIKSYSDCK